MNRPPCEFTYEGIQYQIGVMDVFAQMDVAAKLAPLIVPFATLAMKDGTLGRLAALNAVDSTLALNDPAAAEKAATERREKMMSILFDNLGSLTEVFAKMPKDDRDTVVKHCLAVVQRKPPNATGWQPIWNAGAGRLQYDDLNSLPAMVFICSKVIGDKLSSFFPASLS